MIQTENFQKIEVDSATSLRTWLEANHGKKESVWLVTYKKSMGEKYVSTSEVLDELLCFGWIDGIRRKMDDTKTMQLIGPRRSQHWAKTYKERAMRLIEEGRMHMAGLKSIETSKVQGLWNFMDDVDNLVIPDDLQEALAKSEDAMVFFESINDSSKRFALRWLKLAKTDMTRHNRILKITALAQRGEKLPGS